MVLTTFVALSDDVPDKFKTLETLDGQVFTNAEITKVIAGYAVVFWDGGGKMVAFTNFPAWLRKKYHFDAAAAAAVEKAEAETEKQAAAQASLSTQQAEIIRAQAPIGDPVRVRIRQILVVPSQYKVSANGVEQTLIIRSIPEDVIDFIKRVNATREQFDSAVEEQKSQRQYAATQRSMADATEHYVFWQDGSTTINPDYSSRQLEANLAEAKSNEQLTQIGELKSKLAEMRREEVMKTTILARPLDWVSSYGRVWQFVGIPTAVEH
jgi:hypothetical protein